MVDDIFGHVRAMWDEQTTCRNMQKTIVYITLSNMQGKFIISKGLTIDNVPFHF